MRHGIGQGTTAGGHRSVIGRPTGKGGTGPGRQGPGRKDGTKHSTTNAYEGMEHAWRNARQRAGLSALKPLREERRLITCKYTGYKLGI